MRMNLSKHTLKLLHLRIYTCLIYVTCKRYKSYYIQDQAFKTSLQARVQVLSPPGHAHPRSIFFPKVVCAACTPLSPSQPGLHSSVSPWRCTIVIQQYSQNLIQLVATQSQVLSPAVGQTDLGSDVPRVVPSELKLLKF